MNAESIASLESAPCAGRWSGRESFALPGAEPRYSRDRPIEIRSVRIEVELDFRTRSISGTVTTEFAAVADRVERVAFDAEEMEILEVSTGRTPRKFDHHAGRLTVELARPLSRGRTARTVVRYRATPRLGLYFVGEDPDRPGHAGEAWTQGQDDDSRFWFPCVDAPNEKAHTEVVVTVPDSMRALSNGALVNERHDRRGRRRTFHFRQEIPHVPYLVMLAAGRFAVVEDRWRDIPLEYWVAPGREEEARRSFSKTPAMMDYFERISGLAYPYEKYAQICVTDFIFGGMENSTATVLTDRTLHDEHAHQDFSSDGLVAHELAHQWFGDLITCRDWSHGWLNEGFATYFGSMFEVEDLTAEEGPETEGRMIWQIQEGYLGEDSSRYRRPIVSNDYHEPIQLFDAHLYAKGALVLHMLRRRLGDKAFFRAIHAYVERFAGKTATTADLQGVFEENTGRSLQGFFEQWVYRGGHPRWNASFRWDDEHSTAAVTIRHDGAGDEKQPAADVVFRGDVDLEFVCGRRTVRETIRVRRGEETFYVGLPSRPSRVRIDPDHSIVRELKFELPVEMLIAQLRRDTRFSGRVEALSALARDGSPAAAAAIARCLRRDTAWSVRARAAAALATVRSETARNALLRRFRAETHPKVRRAIAGALAAFPADDTVLARLCNALGDADQSYFVRAAAARAIGAIRCPGSFDRLAAAVDLPSWNHTILCGVLAGLAATRDPRAAAILRDHAEPRHPRAVRSSAIAALGGIAKFLPTERERIELREFLQKTADDPLIHVAGAACDALVEVGDPAAAATLQRVADRERNGMLITRARRALRRLGRGGGDADQLRRLRDDLDRVAEENRKLRDRVARLESKSSSHPAATRRR